MPRKKKESSGPEDIDVRLVIEPDDELYQPFIEFKQELGLKSHTEAARVLIKKGFEWFKAKLK